MNKKILLILSLVIILMGCQTPKERINDYQKEILTNVPSNTGYFMIDWSRDDFDVTSYEAYKTNFSIDQNTKTVWSFYEDQWYNVYIVESLIVTNSIKDSEFNIFRLSDGITDFSSIYDLNDQIILKGDKVIRNALIRRNTSRDYLEVYADNQLVMRFYILYNNTGYPDDEYFQYYSRAIQKIKTEMFLISR